MLGNCVLVPATYYAIKEKYEDSPCNHCINKQFGCPNKKPVRVGFNSFIPIEDDVKELPICGIWCKKCKAKNAKVEHEVFWNARRAYAIKCPICGSEFLLYRDKVRAEYTGYTNFKGEFVPADPYGTRLTKMLNETNLTYTEEEPSLVATFGEDASVSPMMEALKKAGLK